MAGVTVERLVGGYCLGEGPHWDHITQKLYFVDIYGHKLCRLDPETGNVTSVTLDGPVGVAVPVDGSTNKFVAGCGTNFVLFTWDSNTTLQSCPTQVLAKVDTEKTGTRINDGKVDSCGRFWGGTMALEEGSILKPNEGSFYSIGSDLVPRKHISPVSISNGLAWSKDDDTFYYIDSLTYQVVAYDFTASTGSISNKRIVFDLKKNNVPGLPDGMTIDTDGNLWVALYFGGAVIQINPKSGELMRTVNIPGAKNVTSVAFGGPNLDVLYVTSSSLGLKEEDQKEQPNAGYVFKITGLGVRGYNAHSFKLSA